MIRTVHLFRAEQSSRLGTERDSQGRVWCQLFPLGTWHRPDFPGGKLELTADFLAELLANWKAGGSPPLPVDYNHEEDGPAAGWIEDLRLSLAGELEGAIKWTDEAAADIKADRRRYLSPTWAMQHLNRRTGAKGGPWLYGAALLNDPFYDSMPRVAASAATAAQPPTQPPTDAPRGKETQRMDKKRICAALGLPEDCGEEEMMVVIESMAKKAKELEDALAKQAASAGDAEKLTAAVRTAVEPLEAQLTAARAETQALKASLLEREVDALVTSAKLAGKPAESFRPFIASAAARDMAEAKRMVDALPVVMATAEKGLSAESPTASTAAEKFELLVQEKLAAGLKSHAAYSLVAREHPELAVLAFPTTTTSTR